MNKGDLSGLSEAVRPKILVSRCITFDHCRWDGGIITSPYMEKLKKYIDFITVCPEADIGCGVPRKPLRLVMYEDSVRMLQYETGADFTEAMREYGANTIKRLPLIDGMLLKERSPSCGISNVKIYAANEKAAAIRKKGSGLFAGAMKTAFPSTPCISEGHLFNFALREHFYTVMFTLARFRNIYASPRIKDLVEFHSRHKYILLSYHQSCMRRMGKLVADHTGTDTGVVFNAYYDLLLKALSRPPRILSPVNVFMHGLGYFSKKIGNEEKRFFLNQLDLYREKKVPFSTCNAVLKSWIIRFDERYLASQYFFNPFPEELIELSDSGK